MSEVTNHQASIQGYSVIKRIMLPITIGAGGLLAMSSIAYLLRHGRLLLITISEFFIVNFTFTMQLYVLPLSFIGLGFIYMYDRQAYRTFFRFRLRADKNHEATWQALGPTLAIAFTVGTSLLMSLTVMANQGTINGTFFRIFPLVVLLAATNAWTEEILSRFVIVAGLAGKVPTAAICWVSAILFGLPHFLGTPSGVFGVLMSGLLGWLLAKSVIETQSLGWALVIHFLQDVVIFGAGAMVLTGN